MDQATLRGLLLEGAFQPRSVDFATPQLLQDKGVPDGILRLVSLSAKARGLLAEATGADGMRNSALYVAACLRLRDGGGDDGKGTPVMSAIDAGVLVEQDFDLLNALAVPVKQFLGLDGAVAAQVDAAKND